MLLHSHAGTPYYLSPEVCQAALQMHAMVFFCLAWLFTSAGEAVQLVIGHVVNGPGAENVSSQSKGDTGESREMHCRDFRQAAYFTRCVPCRSLICSRTGSRFLCILHCRLLG